MNFEPVLGSASRSSAYRSVEPRLTCLDPRPVLVRDIPGSAGLAGILVDRDCGFYYPGWSMARECRRSVCRQCRHKRDLFRKLKSRRSNSAHSFLRPRCTLCVRWSTYSAGHTPDAPVAFRRSPSNVDVVDRCPYASVRFDEIKICKPPIPSHWRRGC